jgi:1-aminocyclopropane-1-carboxylate synthase
LIKPAAFSVTQVMSLLLRDHSTVHLVTSDFTWPPTDDSSADGFGIDVSARTGIQLVGVDVSAYDPASPETLRAFESTVQELKSEGRAPRILILCNPHNPLGFCYPRATLLAYLRFAQKHDMHILSDEIYALSVFENPAVKQPTPFISVLAIDAQKEAECDPARVHVLYGMSKDFGANGLRGGTCLGPKILVHIQELRMWCSGIDITA